MVLRTSFPREPSPFGIVRSEAGTDGYFDGCSMAQDWIIEECGGTKREKMDLLWCQDCQQALPGECSLHGPLIHIRDRAVPVRATLTAPSEISIRLLREFLPAKQAYGAFAACDLPARSVFGPVEAEVVNVLPIGVGKDRLLLKKFHCGVETGYLDLADEARCNWLVYVRPARYAEEQNLAAYQYGERIFYTAVKNITKGTELKVWYAAGYASLMNVSLLQSVDSTEESDDSVEVIEPVDEAPTAVSVIRPTKSLCEPVCSPGCSTIASPTRSDSLMNGNGTVSRRKKGLKPQRVPQPHPHGPSSSAASGSPAPEGPEPSEGSSSEEQDGMRNRDAEREESPGLIEYPSNPAAYPLLNQFLFRPNPLLAAPNMPPAMWSNFAPLASRLFASPFRPLGFAMGERETFSREDSVESGDALDRPKSPESDRSIDIDGDSDSEISGPPIGACAECGKQFATVEKLEAHTAMHADASSRPYSCSFPGCNKFFSSKYKLLRHELIHSQEKRHHCALCHKKFHRKDHLNNHLKVHERSKIRLECRLCGCIFAKKWTYEKHLALHERDQRHQEELRNQQAFAESEASEEMMGSSSSVNGDLLIKQQNYLKKVPLSQKPSHPCDVCGKVFSASKDLRRHMQTHLGIKPNLCLFCPKKFTRKDHVRRHILTVHADRCHEAGIRPAPNSAAAMRERKLGMNDAAHTDSAQD